MKRCIAIVLNSPFHVETTISIYFTLRRMADIEPVIVPLCGDRRGLFSFLDGIGAAYADSEAPTSWFDSAIIVTTRPPLLDKDCFPLAEHPMVKDFRGRRLLINHRCHYAKELYQGEKALCLSPISRSQGWDYIYLCENPALETPAASFDGRNIVFLVQGTVKRRDIPLLRDFLENNREERLKVIIVGVGADSLSGMDPRVAGYQNVSERDFYSLCSQSDFILPLLDPSDCYREQRFSTSYSVSFASMRPVLVRREFHEIYPVPSVTYESNLDFSRKMKSCIGMSSAQYTSMVAQYRNQKESFRKHNAAVLSEYL